VKDTAKKTRRTSKAQWLDMALAVLQTDGIAGVRIEVLAKRLATSKSGFYWHFRDRDHLIKDLLNHWMHEATEVITTNPELLALEPKSRLSKAAEMVLDYSFSRYEIPVQQWALQDPSVARAVRRISRTRLDFARTAFSELGFTGDELDMRAMLWTGYHSMEYWVFAGISRKRRRELIATRIALMTSR
jgi:AcrR family transcriptional regulator